MNRRQMLAAAAGAAASTALPFELTAEESTAYQDALAHHDVRNTTDHEAMWLWGRLFALPDPGSAIPGMVLAPEEFAAYQARLNRVIALSPELLTIDTLNHPLNLLEEAVFVYANAMWDAGFRAGLCMEHARLAGLHRALREPELTLK